MRSLLKQLKIPFQRESRPNRPPVPLKSRLIDLALDFRDATIACLVGMVLMSLAPMLMGWKTTVVVSGSMVPGILPGDVIAAAPVPQHGSQRVPKAGQVLLVDDPAHPGELLMHRLQRYDPNGLMILKGDANKTADSSPVPVANLRGLPRLRMPLIGRPYVWVQQGRYVPVALVGAVVIGLLLWQPKRQLVQWDPARHEQSVTPRFGALKRWWTTVSQPSCTARPLIPVPRATEREGLKPRGGFLEGSDERNRYDRDDRRGSPDPGR